jgi:hypothetical protein
MRESATHSLRPVRRHSPAPGTIAPQPPPRLTRARRAALAGTVAVPAALLLFFPHAPAAAGHASAPEIAIDVCVDRGVVEVDLGCPPATTVAPTSPPPTAPPATTAPVTAPPTTAPPVTAPAGTIPRHIRWCALSTRRAMPLVLWSVDLMLAAVNSGTAG